VVHLERSSIARQKQLPDEAPHDWHSYDQEKRQALDVWGARLEEIVTRTQKTAKIVPPRRGRRPAARLPHGLPHLCSAVAPST